jgi:tRNA threonylcarbamoyladenosine biosynthesis protein TsaB
MVSILAVETSTEWCSVAVLHQGNAFTFHQNVGAQASAVLLPEIQKCLKAAEISLNDIDVFAFGAGPGGFTGLRLACGITQGLAWGVNKPVIAVNSLLSCAQTWAIQNRELLHDGLNVRIVLDARMREVYWLDAYWSAESAEWIPISDAQLDAPEDIPEPVASMIVLGQGLAAYSDRFSKSMKQLVVDDACLPSALAVAQCAKPVFLRGEAISAEKVQPVYVRNKVAQTIAERKAIAQA